MTGGTLSRLVNRIGLIDQPFVMLDIQSIGLYWIAKVTSIEPRRDGIVICVRGVEIMIHHHCWTLALPYVWVTTAFIRMHLILWVSSFLHVMAGTPAFTSHIGIL